MTPEQNNPYTATAAHQPVSVTGEAAAKVLKNTYLLLGMSLMVATGASWFAMESGFGFFNPLLTIGVYFGLLIVTNLLRNSAAGILAVFALTGWLGLTTGPIISVYASIPGGMDIVTMALGGTATIFVVMSAIALVTRKDFSFLSNFLMVGLLVAFIAGIANIFLEIPVLALTVSAVFMLLSSLVIMWQTSAIIHGGETNYILATVTLFVSLYNIFMSLLHLLTALAGDD